MSGGERCKKCNRTLSRKGVCPYCGLAPSARSQSRADNPFANKSDEQIATILRSRAASSMHDKSERDIRLGRWIQFALVALLSVGGIAYKVYERSASFEGFEPIFDYAQTDAVNVVLDVPTMALSIREAIKSSKTGEVNIKDVEVAYKYEVVTAGGSNLRAMVAYSSEERVPPGTSFQPMTFDQFIRAAEDDQHAEAISVDGKHIFPRDRFSDLRIYLKKSLGLPERDLPFVEMRKPGSQSNSPTYVSSEEQR